MTPARIAGELGLRMLRLGHELVVAIVIGAALLVFAVTVTLAGGSGTATRITLTMPCSRVDATTVGHSAYGLDQVLSASCTPVTSHR
jgi:hypothetical protein